MEPKGKGARGLLHGGAWTFNLPYKAPNLLQSNKRLPWPYYPQYLLQLVRVELHGQSLLRVGGPFSWWDRRHEYVILPIKQSSTKSPSETPLSVVSETLNPKTLPGAKWPTDPSFWHILRCCGVLWRSRYAPNPGSKLVVKGRTTTMGRSSCLEALKTHSIPAQNNGPILSCHKGPYFESMTRQQGAGFRRAVEALQICCPSLARPILEVLVSTGCRFLPIISNDKRWIRSQTLHLILRGVEVAHK